MKNDLPEKNLDDWFQEANKEGRLSDKSLEVVQKGGKGGMALAIQSSSLGLQSDELLMIAILLDDSLSIANYHNTQYVIDGHNSVIKALKGTRIAQQQSIRFHTQYLKNYIHNKWVSLQEAKDIDRGNYIPNGHTPLYDAAAQLIMSMMAEKERIREEAGMQVRFGILIVSDGNDERSEIYTADDVKNLVTDILKHPDSIEPDIINFMGIDDGYTDYIAIAKAMGIEDEKKDDGNGSGGNGDTQVIKRVLTPASNEKEIRRAFNTFSGSF